MSKLSFKIVQSVFLSLAICFAVLNITPKNTLTNNQFVSESTVSVEKNITHTHQLIIKANFLSGIFSKVVDFFKSSFSGISDLFDGFDFKSILNKLFNTERFGGADSSSQNDNDISQPSSVEPTPTSYPSPSSARTEGCGTMVPEACELFKMGNNFREAAGLRPLEIDENCINAAQKYSELLQKKNISGHNNDGGPGDRYAREARSSNSPNYVLNFGGKLFVRENLWGSTSPRFSSYQIQKDLFIDKGIPSRGHCHALLDPNVTHGGYGYIGASGNKWSKAVYCGSFANGGKTEKSSWCSPGNFSLLDRVQQ